jgi:hypothetical protein
MRSGRERTTIAERATLLASKTEKMLRAAGGYEALCIVGRTRQSRLEISRILGVGEEIMVRHIKQACERYGVNKRILVAIRHCSTEHAPSPTFFKR